MPKRREAARGERGIRSIYWGFDELLDLVGISLCLTGTLVSLDMIRVAKGAPRAWLIIVAALATMVVYQSYRIYTGISTPDTLQDDVKGGILLLFDALFLTGIALMNASFRKRMKAITP